MDKEVIIDENKYHMISSTTDSNGIIVEVNQDLCDISSYTKEELLGKSHNIVRHPDMPKSIFKDMWETIKSGKTWKGVVKNLDSKGDYYWVRATISPILNKDLEQTYTSIRVPINDSDKEYYSKLYRELLIKENLKIKLP